MDIILDILFWCFMAIVKFVVTPSIMIGTGYSVLFTIVVSIVGSLIGVHLFFNFGKVIFSWWDNKKGGKKAKAVTPGKRRMVEFKNRYGLHGLLVLSGIISVPISAVLAAKYFNNSKSTPWILCVAFAIWSVGLTLLSHYLKTGALI